MTCRSVASHLLLCLPLGAACYAGADGDAGTDGSSSGVVTSTSGNSATGVSATGPTTSATTSATATGATATATNATTDSATTDSATADPTTDSADSTTGEPPGEPAVHWVGRFDASDPSRTRVSWSGSGFVVRFDGAGVSVRLDDAAQYLTVVVDGVVQPTLTTSGGEQDYVLASGLAAGEHVVELYRRTEGSFGPTSVLSVDIDGELLPPPAVTRRIEIVGDSITCGYGNEGVSPCSFSAETENHYLTYGAVAARALGAEISTVAWSGKGIIYNYGTDTNQPMPTLYDRIIAYEAEPTWDYAIQPDVVAINLGTNDFSTDGDPSQEQYVGAYVDFVTHIRDVNPSAYILLLSPSLYGAELTMVEGYLQQVVEQRTQAGDAQIGWANINVDWIGSGCDGHPSVATHMGMGERLTEELQTRLGW